MPVETWFAPDDQGLTGLKSDPPVPASEFGKFRDGLSRVGQIKTDFVIS